MYICQAARDGDLAEVQRLIGQNPALLNSKLRGGRTPLMLASEGGHVRVVQWLLDQPLVAMDAQSTGGCTALLYACFQRRIPVVRLLLERGADPASPTTLAAPL
jgi:ankyrin repeat protein